MTASIKILECTPVVKNTVMSADPDEVAQIALNLARNACWPVFPCSNNKTPTRPKSQG